MLRTRLWMGAILIALTAAVLVADRPPWYPSLFVLLLTLSLAATHELLGLLAPARRPVAWVCYAGIVAILAANWVPHVLPAERVGTQPWPWVAGVLAALVLAALVAEMARYREPGESVNRVALTVFLAAYLGLLPSFLAQLRWGYAAGEQSADARGALAFALAVFVPKSCDIGAYFTGRFLGRHRMTPVLSPKKTWEGLAGGLVTAVVVAFGLNRLGPVLHDAAAAAFGLTVGLAGVLGDLAESLIKRDCGHKDASQVVPGFGGVLDVVDAILFAAPVSYLWLQLG